ncbi:transcription factor SRM1-like [Aristolochia californica]|uniref:transcription factor SRM1-like n=1 Tax=Aristolochia californica TaxID=171875 RepID=UPI0035E119B0
MLRDDLLLNPGASPPGAWCRLQDKLFEEALVLFPEETPDRWGKVAGQVPGKSVWEVREHYAALVHDVSVIEQGKIEIPPYSEWCGSNQISFSTGRSRDGESERKKGVPWTEEEHRRFLIGLQKYGKGDWRSISRHSVLTRTPTQVASHAQKYYLRVNSTKKEKKRSSIHDITNPEGGSSAPATDADWIDWQPVPPSTYVGQRGGTSSAYPHFG